MSIAIYDAPTSPDLTIQVQPDQEGLAEPRPAQPAARPDLDPQHRHDTDEATA